MEQKLRRWCFTYNNYTEGIVQDLKEYKCDYLICGKEVGEKGTPHLQGYWEFKSGVRFATLKKAFPAIHLEACKGSPQQNIDYCSKDGDYFEVGKPKNQGKRSDLDAVMEDISGGMSKLDVFHEHPSIAFRYPKALEEYRRLATKKNLAGYKEKDVRVYWGETGTGKTRSAMEEFPDAFIVSSGLTGFWWSGYDGESTVVMDEFRGGIPLCQLLRILDGYPVQVSVHGGSAYLLATTVIITSNVDPDLWYQNADDRSLKALKRRISSVKYFGPEQKCRGNTEPDTVNEE